ncbi:MAG: GntR family transcriptional regulator [Kiritimatiellales bacterium]|nr:GntR family transcriptional regulator [Kiritimatiellales bacterium]
MNTTEQSSREHAPTSEKQVTDKLRSHILNGDLPVGNFLSQRKLAELTGSSVISVRGALRQLENEGLIVNVPRIGVRIPEDTPQTVRDRYLIRKALETAAVEQICGRLADDAKNKLIETARELDRLVGEHEAETYPEFARLHHEFHLLIASSSRSPLLVQMLRRVINPSLMMLNAARSWKVPSELHQNHIELAEAILSGNMKEAVQAIQNHIQVGLESELAAL